MLSSSRRRLITVSWLRIFDAWVASLLVLTACAMARVELPILLLATCLALLAGFLGDARTRRAGKAMLGSDPTRSAPPVLRAAIAEAAAPLRIDRRRIFPRHLPSRSAKGAFAAGVLPTEQGDVILIGDEVVARVKDASSPHKNEGERRFAFDEVRAVLGHELAHNLPGTRAASRLLAIPYRFSTTFTHIVFWVAVAREELVVAAAGSFVFWLLYRVRDKNVNLREFSAFMRLAILVAATLLSSGSFVLLAIAIVWPQLRPITAMAVQRRIEHWCDMVAVHSGADPSALARMLQRFEPERLRYWQPPLWARLTATHPPLHQRIVDLDHATTRR